MIFVNKKPKEIALVKSGHDASRLEPVALSEHIEAVEFGGGEPVGSARNVLVGSIVSEFRF